MYYHSKFAPVQGTIEKGLDKLRKWYTSVDESATYFICLGIVCSFIVIFLFG